MTMLATMMMDDSGFALLGAALGAGLAAGGAAIGIGRLAGSAVESQARQPEAGGRIFTMMLVAAALIEGFTFFALIVCMQMGSRAIEALKIAMEAMPAK